MYLLSRLPPRRRWVAWTVLTVTASFLLVAGVVGLQRRADPAIAPLFAPVALAGGAVLQPMPDQLSAALASTQKVRRALLAALALVAVFWVTTTVTQQRGAAAATAIEISLLVRPQAVVYSRARLQITGPGVTLSKLDATDAAFAYRYSGLRPLIHAGGRWFLLPAGWTPTTGRPSSSCRTR